MNREHSIALKLMGTAFELTLVCGEEGEELLERGVNEIRRIEALLTEFNETSDTSRINQAAGKHPVQVAPEVYRLLQRCQHLSQLTQGAFDITAVTLRKLYKFNREAGALPEPELLKQALEATGYNKLKLMEDSHVFLEKEGMRIGFGAIGKGYAADRVRNMLQPLCPHGGVINASGDLTAWGTKLNGEPWTIGIADPDHADKALLWLPVLDGSVATSGDYEQFMMVDGIRYSHNIDPRSGKPTRGIRSATIFSPSAEMSDALCTAVFVMGEAAGLYFINQLPGVHCLIIDAGKEIRHSKKLKINLV